MVALFIVGDAGTGEPYHATGVTNERATRDLQSLQLGGDIPAATIYDATMAALSGLFARVIADEKAFKD